MEHLSNCHGEWLYLLQMLGALPLLGVWLRSQFSQHDHEDH